MKRLTSILLPLACMVSLAACNTGGVNSAGSQVTTAADDLYTAASATGEALVKGGLMDKATFKVDDARAYAVLLQVRAGNATIQQLAAVTALLTGAVK